MKITSLMLLAAIATLAGARPAHGASTPGTVEVAQLTSDSLKGTLTGLDPVRDVYVYLPPGYAQSTKRYPVIYFFHSIFWSAKQSFADGSMQARLDRGIGKGSTKEFIFVEADYSSPVAGSFYENSPTTGRWLDFTAKELVPFVDRRFRTIAEREARGLVGDFMGGRGAFKLAMTYPDLFSVLYAMHPVATGRGLVPMTSRPDWNKIHAAHSFKDVDGDRMTQVFLAMSQAYLPNPSRPPFYCDFIAEMKDGVATPNVENLEKLVSAFSLDRMTAQEAAGLRRMRAIKFDWSRYDDNQDHVYANQAFTRRLDELGIKHSAEEYGGSIWWRENWIPEEGRFDAEVLPFFGKYLKFD
jgi:pimeloyl-ACP methyl ester carboxylesterase